MTTIANGNYRTWPRREKLKKNMDKIRLYIFYRFDFTYIHYAQYIICYYMHTLLIFFMHFYIKNILLYIIFMYVIIINHIEILNKIFLNYIKYSIYVILISDTFWHFITKLSTYIFIYNHLSSELVDGKLC